MIGGCAEATPHGRTMYRGVLCDRLARDPEHNKQCAAFDSDCVNISEDNAGARD
jgi:hypothetical protein